MRAEATGLAAAIRAAAEAAPLLVITAAALSDLAAELGSFEAAMAELLAVAEAIGHPVAVNLPTGADSSSTAFVAPRSWSEERLKGWAAGHHQELEAQFGMVSRVQQIGPNRAERRRRKRGD